MAITSMVRIFASIAMIIFAGAVTVSATGAFFSDSEESNDNAFTAGSIDLAVGSTFTSESNGGNTFASSNDNDGRMLYAFTDLKPGDAGQGTFQLSVTANQAYLCARSATDEASENTRNDAEVDAGDDSDDVGELQEYLQFAIFNDDNENGVYDAGEPLNINQDLGDGDGFTAEEIGLAGWIAAADTTAPNTWLIEEFLTPGVTYHAGFMYCFGNFESDGSCSMVLDEAQNAAQTDGISGNIEFQAIQTRNNDGFMCSSLNAPVDPEIG